MKSISSIHVVFSHKQPFLCHICPMARQTRLPFQQSTHNSTAMFYLVHVDLWEPYQTPTHDNFRFFLTLVDDFSRSSWKHLFSHKSNGLHVIETFTNMVENQFKTTLKWLDQIMGLNSPTLILSNSFSPKALITKNLVHTHLNKMVW